MGGIISAHDFTMLFDQLIHTQGTYKPPVIIRQFKLRCSFFMLPGIGLCIIVKRNTVHKTPVSCISCGLHYTFRPLIVGNIRASGYTIQPVIPIIPAEGTVTAEFLSILLRRHIASASPILISHTPVFYTPCFGMPIFSPQL